MSYRPGYFTEPCRAWFGKNWNPHAVWTSTARRATRTSADGDNMNIKVKSVANWTATKAK